MLISKPAVRDIDAIKSVADANRNELGFILRVQIQEAVEQKRIMVATVEDKITGFIIYRHRKKDLQTTVAEICILKNYRGQGLGRELIDALVQECNRISRSYIQLKCPIDLPANEFYKRLGFCFVAIEPGKSRKLNIWRLQIAQGR